MARSGCCILSTVFHQQCLQKAFPSARSFVLSALLALYAAARLRNPAALGSPFQFAQRLIPLPRLVSGALKPARHKIFFAPIFINWSI